MVDRTKREIIRLYLDDFQKIDPTGNAERLFLHIPAQLSSGITQCQPYPVIGDKSVSGDHFKRGIIVRVSRYSIQMKRVSTTVHSPFCFSKIT